jgi:CRISPR-associated protein Csd1
MIFPALHRFAQSRGLLDDLDFTEQTLHAVIHLSASGAFTGLFPVGDKKAPVKKSVSRIAARNSAAIACLGADTANRVLPGLEPDAKPITVATQSLFLDQLRAVHVATGQPGLDAVIGFLADLAAHPEKAEPLRATFDSLKLKLSDWVTFQVEGHAGYLVEWPALKTWWREQCAAKRAASAAESTEPLIPCMVTGELCNPVRTHGTRVKVAPGGLPGGVALVSSDKPAFGSYGFDKSLVSPMSEAAVEGYIRAINFLGDKLNSDHHYRTSDTIFLFWCDRPEITANPAKAIEEGQPDTDDDWMFAAIRDAAPIAPLSDSAKTAVSVIRSADAGTLTAGADAAKARFYCLALSGSSARGVIRGWIDQPLPEAVRHMREWFEDLTIPLDRPIFDPADKNKDLKKRRRLADTGTPWSRWPLWKLLSALEGKSDTTAELARLRPLLFDLALIGRAQPVPGELLSLACRRIATSGDCPPIRAALIQLFVRRFHHQSKVTPTTMSDVDSTIQQSPAFACGRLLRVLEGVQKKALGDRNASVVDKFYSSASSTPAAVLGHLVANAQPHLAKLRKDKTSAGLAHWFDEQITDIVEIIVKNGGYPSTNNPVGQGEFALGFYYQRILARKQKPEADDTPETEAAE